MIDWDSCVLWLDSRYFSESYWWDRSKYANDGVVYGAKFKEDSFYFGGNSYIEIPDDDSLDVTDKMSIEIVTKGVYSGASKGLLDKGNSASAKLVNYYVYFNSGQGRFYIGDGTTFNSVFTSQLTDYQQYHIFFTLNDDYLKAYVNGSFCNQSNRTINPKTNNNNLLIGALTTLPSYLFIGKIYLIRIYKKDFSEDEIKILATMEGF